MNRVKLSVAGVSTGQTSGSYTLILAEENSNRKLPVVIGSFEAQAIALTIEKVVPFRPMTHDLFVNFFGLLDVTMHEVVIYNLHEGVFHAKMVIEFQGEIKELDARTSDAIALALRFKCPIYTYEDIMDAAGVEFNDDLHEAAEAPPQKPKSKPAEEPREFTKMTLDQLHTLLEKSLAVEDYIKAAKIRDEIQRRQK